MDLNTHTPYIPPHPQRGTPYHRYVLLLLPQSDPTKPLEIPIVADSDRLGFDTRSFLQQWGLDGAKGGGAHMFREVWDTDVSKVYSRVLRAYLSSSFHPHSFTRMHLTVSVLFSDWHRLQVLWNPSLEDHPSSIGMQMSKRSRNTFNIYYRDPTSRRRSLGHVCFAFGIYLWEAYVMQLQPPFRCAPCAHLRRHVPYMSYVSLSPEILPRLFTVIAL